MSFSFFLFIVFRPFFHTLPDMTQDQAYDILTMGYNVFLTWPAGSGKTFLINRFIRYAHEHNMGIAITASTGIAATHIGGVTVHSWSGIGIKDTLSTEDIDQINSREYLIKRFTKTSILIIDEISMLSGEFLDGLDRLLQNARVNPAPFGGMQVVLVGDFFQLPPVSRGSWIEFAFEHPSWRTWGLATCVLEEQFRQKSISLTSQEQDPLLLVLNEIRSWDVTSKSLDLLNSRRVPIETEDHTELFTRNISVDNYNKERLNQIRDDIFLFEMEFNGPEKLVDSLKKWCLAPESLVLKKWARVMFVKNNFEAGYVNGSIGHIIGKQDWYPIVELLSGDYILAEPVSWAIEEDGRVKASIVQVPLRLAWAITVHKSQGMTLDTAVMDLSDAFVAGQWYVALSRVRSLDGLILRGLNSLALEIDPRVRNYDRVLRATSQEVVRRLKDMTPVDIKTRREKTIMRFGGVLESIASFDSSKLPKTPGAKKTPTHEETWMYLSQKISIDDIATMRGLKPSTILSHIEMLLDQDSDIDLEYLRPEDGERLEKILWAFRFLETKNLSPIREYLLDIHDETFDYDEVRLARLFLSKTERRAIDAAILYKSEGIEL